MVSPFSSSPVLNRRCRLQAAQSQKAEAEHNALPVIREPNQVLSAPFRRFGERAFSILTDIQEEYS